MSPNRFANALSRTWLATGLFVATSTAIWSSWLSWGSAQTQILPTLVVTPIVWWWIVASRTQPKAIRGVVAGALIGLGSQVVPSVLPMIWQSITKPPDHGGDLVMIAVVTLYLFVGIAAALLGALLGWIVVVTQRVIDRRRDVPI